MTSRNAIIASKNRVDAGTVYGGGWITALPITNVQDSDVSNVARTPNLDTANTKFFVDLGESTYSNMIALINTNASTSAQVRIQGSTTAGFSTVEFDTGWTDFFDPWYSTLTLHWEDANWWTGRPTDEQLEGYKRSHYVFLENLEVFQYLSVEFDDPDNTDLYFEVGRAWCGPYWLFDKNPVYGLQIGFEPRTLVDKTLAGVAKYDERDSTRFLTMQLDFMEEDEAFEEAYELIRKVGIDKEIIVSLEPDNLKNKFRQTFHGRFRELDPLEKSAYGLHGMAFALEELV